MRIDNIFNLPLSMAQILRLCKIDVPTLTRSYGRSRGTHYDTLGVSRNATQREIKAAFFKLSKEMHPDATGNKNHADFVKINEAYSVLSKHRTKQQYDMNLRKSHVHRASSSADKNSYYSYDDLRAAYGFPDPKKTYSENPSKSNFFLNIHPVLLCFLIMFCSITFHFILLNFSPIFNSKMLLRRSAEIEKENKKRMAIARSRTPQEQEEFIQNCIREAEERERRDKGLSMV